VIPESRKKEREVMARKGQFKLLQVVVGEDKSITFIPLKPSRELSSTADAIAFLKEANIAGKVAIVDCKAVVEVASQTVTKNVVTITGQKAKEPKAQKPNPKRQEAGSVPPQSGGTAGGPVL